MTGFEAARAALRSRTLRQALYDRGEALMGSVVVNLHGPEHLARRRVETRLFRRDVFEFYENDHLPHILDTTVGPASATGGGDLFDLARRTMMALSVGVAGIDTDLLGSESDRSDSDASGEKPPDADFERLFHLMETLARASTVGDATGDVEQIIADGNTALADFDENYFRTARRRRSSDTGGTVDPSDPVGSTDMLSTLLQNAEELSLSEEEILREIAYYVWVGAHSTAVQLVHAMHHVFDWVGSGRVERSALTEDPALMQAFVHESVRLHPASPVAKRTAVDVTALGGVTAQPGDDVVIDIESANRDRSVFGDAADEFDPYRTISDSVPRWGLSFGSGMHACLGQELAAGLGPTSNRETPLFGAIAIMSRYLLEAGARPDPEDPPTSDTSTTRAHFARYPVRF